MHQIARKFFYLILLLGVVICLAIPLFAQEAISFKQYSLEQGLSQSSVRSIVSDRQGFIWLATDEGLNRFDGHTFKYYKNSPTDPHSLSHNSTICVYLDSRGTLWTGTTLGLNRFDAQTEQFTRYLVDDQHPHTISNDIITSIGEDQAHNLWVGTFNGLNRLEPQSDQFVSYHYNPNNPQSLSSDHITAIYQDRKGRLWIGTNEGLNLQQGADSFIRMVNNPSDPHSLSDNEITSIYQDSSGILWVGTRNGLNRWDEAQNQFTVYEHEPDQTNSLLDNRIISICEDRLGQLWLGTHRGLSRFNAAKTSFTSFTTAEIPPDTHISSIIQDASGTIWLGTFFQGFFRYDPLSQSFTTYRHSASNPNSLIFNSVWTIYEDRQGLIWLGTGRGLNTYDPVQQQFTNRTSLVSAFPGDIPACWVIYQDSSGSIWVATSSGVYVYNESDNSVVQYKHQPNDPTSIASSLVGAIYQDRLGNIWLGTDGGLSRFDSVKKTFTNYVHNPQDPHSLSNNKIRSILEDNAGYLWISTTNGLNRFDPKQEVFQVYNRDNSGLSSNAISALYQDSQGILWIGTSTGGLNRFDPKTERFQVYTDREGLPENLIYTILPDNQGYLWLSTNKGLARFDPRQGTCKNYDTAYGLQSNEFNSHSACKTRGGLLFFGGVNGFSIFDPQNIKDNTYVPPIVITDIKLFSQPFEKATVWFKQAQQTPNTPNLQLSYKENFLSFEFAALSYQLLEKNHYAYKLEGLDKDWVEAGSRNYANYTDLAPGDYTFRVKACNNDGVWNEAAFPIKLQILPPLWRTWWAYSLYLIGIGALIYTGIYYRLRTLEQRNFSLACEVKKRTDQLAQALAEIKSKNLALIEAKESVEDNNRQLQEKNLLLDQKNHQLDEKVEQLVNAQQQANRIFSVLAEALPGTVLDGKYMLKEKIGAGGFGIVYKGTHLSLKRDIAIKVFKPTPGNDSAQNLARFQFEAVSASRVNHPNAVTILDSGISKEGIAFLVMELLNGHSLREELQRYGRLSLVRCAQILLPICDVLDKTHAQNIVHRDIKPDNIFLHRSVGGEVIKVLDFGIAKMFTDYEESQSLEHFTATGHIVGTPVYMAPERLTSLPYNGQADVYSVGIILYQMLCGKLPLSEANNLFSLIHLRLKQDMPPPSQFRADLSPAIDEVILKALERDPDKRLTAKQLGEQFLLAAGLSISDIQINQMATQSFDITDYQIFAGQSAQAVLSVLLAYDASQHSIILDKLMKSHPTLYAEVVALLADYPTDDQKNLVLKAEPNSVKAFVTVSATHTVTQSILMETLAKSTTNIPNPPEPLTPTDKDK